MTTSPRLTTLRRLDEHKHPCGVSLVPAGPGDHRTHLPVIATWKGKLA